MNKEVSLLLPRHFDVKYVVEIGYSADYLSLLVIANAAGKAAFSTLYYEGNFKPILTSIFDLFVSILQDQWDLGWNVEILVSFQGFPSLTISWLLVNTKTIELSYLCKRFSLLSYFPWHCFDRS